eukprot:2363704-Rhodomonas_salina.4
MARGRVDVLTPRRSSHNEHVRASRESNMHSAAAQYLCGSKLSSRNSELEAVEEISSDRCRGVPSLRYKAGIVPIRTLNKNG